MSERDWKIQDAIRFADEHDQRFSYETFPVEDKPGWSVCPRRCKRMFDELGVRYEEAMWKRGTEEIAVLHAPEPITLICVFLKAKWCRWALKKLRDDPEFAEALAAIQLIDPNVLAIVAFIVEQREAEIASKKK